jgi:hypothetical protein
LASNEIDHQAVGLIRKWIEGLRTDQGP